MCPVNNINENGFEELIYVENGCDVDQRSGW